MFVVWYECCDLFQDAVAHRILAAVHKRVLATCQQAERTNQLHHPWEDTKYFLHLSNSHTGAWLVSIRRRAEMTVLRVDNPARFLCTSMYRVECTWRSIQKDISYDLYQECGLVFEHSYEKSVHYVHHFTFRHCYLSSDLVCLRWFGCIKTSCTVLKDDTIFKTKYSHWKKINLFGYDRC